MSGTKKNQKREPAPQKVKHKAVKKTETPAPKTAEAPRGRKPNFSRNGEEVYESDRPLQPFDLVRGDREQRR